MMTGQTSACALSALFAVLAADIHMPQYLCPGTKGCHKGATMRYHQDKRMLLWSLDDCVFIL